MSLFLFALLALVGCKQTPKPSPTEDENSIPKGEPIGETVQVEISIASVVVDKKEVAKREVFDKPKYFSKEHSGPFSLEKDPSTAHIALEIKIPEEIFEKDKELTIKDFSATIENQNSYLKPLELSPTKNPFVTAIDKDMILAKGENNILVKIENKKTGDEGTYHLKVNYSGGPGKDYKKLIPGIYCPTLRKLSEEEKARGEKEECLWLMAITST